MASERLPSTSAMVLVLGGDAIVGQALELLLRSAECNVRFLSEPSLDEPGVLDGVQLLLVAPGLSDKRREALLALVNSKTVGARIPVLELVSNAQGAQDGVGHLVPWPCQPEELKQWVKAALLAGSETGQDGLGLANPPDEATEHRGLNTNKTRKV